MSNIIDCLEKRGLIEALTHETLSKEVEKPIKIYIGFDPTADSLHLGHLMGVIILSWFQRYGHTPVVVLGGATARVGDPSGKSTERPLLSDDEIIANTEAIEKQFNRMLSPKEGPSALIVNNNSWLSSFSFISFLRDVGKDFRLGPMLSKESVRSRISSEEGMSFTEFTYQILQAYDFYHLFNEGVMLQGGGSDQWGNLIAGIDLIRKKTKKSAYGITFPLLTRSDGKKFGKSEGGAIWLSEEKLSPYDFYQYLFSLPDSDVISLMRKLTFMDLEEIAEYEERMEKEGYQPNSAQKRLAEEVTRFVHGEEGVEKALRVTREVAPGASTTLSVDTLEVIKKEVPNFLIKWEEMSGKKVIDLLAQLGIIPSKSEGVRLIKNGGIKRNNEKITLVDATFSNSDLIGEKYVLIGIGKKRKMIVEVTGFSLL